MPIKKGQILNPKGSDGGKNVKATMCREMLIPEAKKTVNNLIRLRNSSDESISLSATKEILDRLYGKAPQSLELSGEVAQTFTFTDKALTAKEFMERFAPQADEVEVNE
jgi:ferritin-like protein